MHSKPHSGDQILGTTFNGDHRSPSRRSDADASPMRGFVSQLDLARMIERVSRRFLDYLRLELTKLGVDDISPSQVMVLLTIGAGEIAVRDLLDRGHYVGSNASYNLKQLVESGYLDRGASPRDRRLARISLSPKGQLLCERLRLLDETSQFGQNPEIDLESDLQTTHDTLRRLEQWWSDALRYGGILLASCTSYSFIVQDQVNLLT
ncbi:DNA-binding MarR family transcriptional regulator [Bosea psychrotolerans]|uniref:DNA-binding MarR family transcriptional regulator n=2 Tax=Bosea psychrotolerans TaxID=1871628 RepID=A0A2S4MIB1_9HYPH|nr:DNA-binding MarR family transcriptional regulator [Bosea psychrotolerans]